MASLYSSMVPSNTVAAGPFIHTALSPPAQETVNAPPRVSRRTGESSSPRRMPLTSRAAAPAREQLNVPGIDAVGEPRMLLEPRALRRDRCRSHVRDDLHRMRV